MGEEGENESSKQETPEVEVPIEKKDAPVSDGPSIGSRIKNWILILLFLSIIILAGTFWLWKTGVDDLKDDNTFLIVVQQKDVAKAGSIYDLSQNKAEIINVATLTSLNNLGRFFNDAQSVSGRKIDRMVVIRVETLTQISSVPSIQYNGLQIPSRDVGGYISDELFDERIQADDPAAIWKGKLLSEWVELHSQEIQDANFASGTFKSVSSEFRKGGIVIYPRNRAVMMLKYIPVEKLLL